MNIDSIKFRGHRCFKTEWTGFECIEPVNVIIGRNNTGTVTGAMNFFGQMGAFFLALMFGKIADLADDFNYPLFIVSFVTFAGCMLWLVIDPTKQVNIPAEENR